MSVYSLHEAVRSPSGVTFEPLIGEGLVYASNRLRAAYTDDIKKYFSLTVTQDENAYAGTRETAGVFGFESLSRTDELVYPPALNGTGIATSSFPLQCYYIGASDAAWVPVTYLNTQVSAVLAIQNSSSGWISQFLDCGNGAMIVSKSGASLLPAYTQDALVNAYFFAFTDTVTTLATTFPIPGAGSSLPQPPILIVLTMGEVKISSGVTEETHAFPVTGYINATTSPMTITLQLACAPVQLDSAVSLVSWTLTNTPGKDNLCIVY